MSPLEAEAREVSMVGRVVSSDFCTQITNPLPHDLISYEIPVPSGPPSFAALCKGVL